VALPLIIDFIKAITKNNSLNGILTGPILKIGRRLKSVSDSLINGNKPPISENNKRKKAIQKKSSSDLQNSKRRIIKNE